MALYRESLIFRIGTPDPAMFWSGHTDLLVPEDDILPDDEIALGAGELADIPDLDQLINGVAQRLDITLSGVSARVIALAQEAASDVPGAPVNIGTLRFGEDWQPSGGVAWEWAGEARRLSVGSRDTENGRTRALTLTVAAGDTTRSRSPLAFFTDSDQRRRSSDDAIFSHVAAINSGTSRRWGPK